MQTLTLRSKYKSPIVISYDVNNGYNIYIFLNKLMLSVTKSKFRHFSCEDITSPFRPYSSKQGKSKLPLQLLSSTVLQSPVRYHNFIVPNQKVVTVAIGTEIIMFCFSQVTWQPHACVIKSLAHRCTKILVSQNSLVSR